jgi:glycosyltransferase involved in cell wall biosynthesis
MNSKKKILIILTPGFPQSETDSTCLPMQQSLVKALQKNYPAVETMVLSFQYPYQQKNYTWFGTTVISFNGQNKGGIKKLLLRRKLNHTLKTINNNNTIIGLLSFWYGECAVVGKRFADKHQLKHFCWVLGQDARKENKHPGRLQANAGELIALSDFLQDEFERNHITRPQHLIIPGIETVLITAATTRNIDILGVGSLIPLKQFDIFIAIIAEVKKQLPGIKAMLIGTGPEEEKLRMLIIQNGLQDNIIFTGELSYDKVLQLMQQTKIVLHPSSYEGFSGVCQEALCNGAHVISFCWAMNEAIEQWHIVKDKPAMTEKIITILQNPGTNYKPATIFSIDETARQMMELFTG